MRLIGRWNVFRYGAVNPAFSTHVTPSSRTALIGWFGSVIWLHSIDWTMVNLAVVSCQWHIARRFLVGCWRIIVGFVMGVAGAGKELN